MRELGVSEVNQVSGGLTDAQFGTLVGTGVQMVAQFAFHSAFHVTKGGQPSGIFATHVLLPIVSLVSLGLGYEIANISVESRQKG